MLNRNRIIKIGMCMLLAACGGEPEDAKFGPYEGGVSMRYEYDALGRLVIYEVDGDVHTQYCLDAAGNRTMVSATNTNCNNL
jgi:hypothetical protein